MPNHALTLEGEEHYLATKLRAATLCRFEQPILDFVKAALESDSLIVKRAAVAAIDDAGAIDYGHDELFTALLGGEAVCMVHGADEGEARSRLYVALAYRGVKAVDAADFDLREPTPEEMRCWEKATTVPLSVCGPEHNVVPHCVTRQSPRSLFLTEAFNPPPVVPVEEPAPVQAG